MSVTTDDRKPFAQAPLVSECELPNSAATIERVSKRAEPIILRGFVSDWPVVDAARQSDRTLIEYLMKFDQGLTVPVSAGPASLDGRLFYNDTFTGLNAERGNAHFKSLLERVFQYGQDPKPPVIYMASMDLEACVPSFGAQNHLDFGGFDPLASIWIGTRTRIAAHNDLPMNIACVAAGRRRFTLFPPDQTPNLYPGPFELTPAGRPISLVDFHNPNLERYPNFARAIETARVAELEPGDALFIPSMWWHHVEATGNVNVLVNYWWRNAPSFLGTPQDALSHAILALRDLPPADKQIWRDVFEHYVFKSGSEVADHIPPHARGILNPIDEAMADRVRGFLSGRLKK